MGKEIALSKLNPKEIDLIKNTVAKGATDTELQLFLYIAGKRGLNPLTGQIHFVKRKQKNASGEYEEVGTVQTGIDGFRLIAQRTEQYTPSPKPTQFDYNAQGNLARATVYGIKIINGQGFEFSASAKYSEYVQLKTDNLPTRMWGKMPETMLEKCAEAKMLRRGFPEELSGLYTSEEMGQADNPEIIVSKAQPPTSVVVIEEKSEEAFKKEHWCAKHNTAYRLFKKGKSQWYSHKIEGTDKWCNEKKKTPETLIDSEPEPEEELIPDKDKSSDFESISYLLLKDISDGLNKLIKGKKWELADIKERLSQLGGIGGTPDEMVKSLSQEMGLILLDEIIEKGKEDK